MIAAYSPEARGRSERAFATHQGRLPKELALVGITGMNAANRYLQDVYRLFHGPRQLAAYDAQGAYIQPEIKAVA